METKLLDKQDVSAKFEVTIPAQDVSKTYETVLRTIARQVKIPGFRPGKAPKGVLIQRIGQDALDQEVRDELLEKSYPEAVKTLELTPVHAHFHAHEPSEGNDYTFEVEVELYPTIELPDIGEIIIDTAKQAVSDEMVEETVEQLRREHALRVPVEREIEPTDYVMVETLHDGEPSGNTLPIDLESVAPDFAEQLLGKKAGDEVELFFNLGDDEDDADEEEPEASASDESEVAETENAEDEAQAEAAPPSSIKVVVRDVKEKEKPEVDDEFAKTLGFDTWGEADAQIRESLQQQLNSETLEDQRNEFIEKLVAETDFDIPQSLVNRRKRFLLNDLARDLERRGVSMEDYVKRLDEEDNREDFEAELSESATEAVKRDLVLERLLEERQTTLSNEEFNAAVQYMAMRQGMDLPKFRREMGQEWLANYRFMLTRDKAVREALQSILPEEEDEQETTEPEAAPSAQEDPVDDKAEA